MGMAALAGAQEFSRINRLDVHVGGASPLKAKETSKSSATENKFRDVDRDLVRL
jgi:hypothetical protein